MNASLEVGCFVCGQPNWHITLPEVKVAIDDIVLQCADLVQVIPFIATKEKCDEAVLAFENNCGCEPGAIATPLSPYTLEPIDWSLDSFGVCNRLSDGVDVLGNGELIIRQGIEDVEGSVTVDMEYAGATELIGLAWIEHEERVPMTAIIGLPAEDDVRKYDILFFDDDGMQPSIMVRQKLWEAYAIEKYGRTKLRFSKYLVEPWEIEVKRNTEMQLMWFLDMSRSGVFKMSFTSCNYLTNVNDDFDDVWVSDEEEANTHTWMKSRAFWALTSVLVMLLIVLAVLHIQSRYTAKCDSTSVGAPDRCEEANGEEATTDGSTISDNSNSDKSDGQDNVSDSDSGDSAGFYKQTMGNDTSVARSLFRDREDGTLIAMPVQHDMPRTASFFLARYVQNVGRRISHEAYTLSSIPHALLTNIDGQDGDVEMEVFA
jgi:hypothetical protein